MITPSIQSPIFCDNHDDDRHWDCRIVATPGMAVGLTRRPQCHIQYGMKMTMHINEELLDRVIRANGFESKTDAVKGALREMDRRFRWKEFIKQGLKFEPGELAASVDPDYDVMEMRLAEKPIRYGKEQPR